MDKKIILFNSPPGAGKDFSALVVLRNFKNAVMDKFARILKERTHALYGFPDRDMYYYEDCKEIPNDDFLGLTPRQAYINVSEVYFKPVHGKRVFGELLAKELDKSDSDIIAISDSGFVEEAEVLIEKYGANNVKLIRIHRDECDFSNDSRSYITLPVDTIDIVNTGDEFYVSNLLDVLDF